MGKGAVELALANILHSFDWELPPGVKKEDIDTDALPGITMCKKIDLRLQNSMFSAKVNLLIIENINKNFTLLR